MARSAPKSDEDLWDSPSFDSAGSPSPHASWGDAESGGKDESVDPVKRNISMDSVTSPRTVEITLQKELAAKSDECVWLQSQLAQKNEELAESRAMLAELKGTSQLTIKTEREKRKKMEKQLEELQETVWGGEDAAVLKRQIENLQAMVWQMDPILAKEQIRACDIRAKTVVLLEEVYRFNEEMRSVEGMIDKEARRRRTSEVATTNLGKLLEDKDAEITFLREQISEERIRDEKHMASAQDEITELRTKLSKEEEAVPSAEDELREELRSAQAAADALSTQLAEQSVGFAQLQEALAASQLSLAAREEEAERLREELAALNAEHGSGEHEGEAELRPPNAMARFPIPLSEQTSRASSLSAGSSVSEEASSEEAQEEAREETRAAPSSFSLFDDEPGAGSNVQGRAEEEEEAVAEEKAEGEKEAAEAEEVPRVLVLGDLLAENSSQVSSSSWSPQSSPKLPPPSSSSNPFEISDPAELEPETQLDAPGGGGGEGEELAFDFPVSEPFSPTAQHETVDLPPPPARCDPF